MRMDYGKVVAGGMLRPGCERRVAFILVGSPAVLF